MHRHIDLLGWLHVLWGAFGVLAGLSLGVLAIGTRVTLIQSGPLGPGERAAVWVFLVCGGLLAGAGVAMITIGRRLALRRPAGRLAALVAAVPNLVVVPFGTALGIYAFWVLLNNDARREFGPTPRSSPQIRPVGGV